MDKYYKSIDELKAYRWFKFKETGNGAYLLRDSNMFEPGEIKEDISEIIEDIGFQLVDVFGIDKNFKNILQFRRSILKHNLKIQKLEIEGLKGNYVKDKIGLEQKKLKSTITKLNDILNKKSSKFDYESECITISQILSLQIDPHKITLRQFYIYNNKANEQSNRHKQASQRRKY